MTSGFTCERDQFIQVDWFCFFQRVLLPVWEIHHQPYLLNPLMHAVMVISYRHAVHSIGRNIHNMLYHIHQTAGYCQGLLVGRLSEQRDPIRAVAFTSPAFSPVVFSCLIKCVIRVKQSVLRVVFERGSLSWRSSAPIAATSAMDQMFKNHRISVECMYTDVTLSFMPQTTVMPALLIIMCALSHDVEVWKRGFAVTVTLPISRVRTGSEKKFRVFAFFFFIYVFLFIYSPDG